MIVEHHVQQLLIGLIAERPEQIDETGPSGGDPLGAQFGGRRPHDRLGQRVRPAPQRAVGMHGVDAAHGDHLDQGRQCPIGRMPIAQAPGSVPSDDLSRMFQQVDQRLVGKPVIDGDQRLDRDQGGDRPLPCQSTQFSGQHDLVG